MEFVPDCYLAFVLDEASRTALLSKFTPVNSRTVCHHVTLMHPADRKSFDELQSEMSLSELEVTVYGYAWSDGVECFAVSVNGLKSRCGKLYHITLSVEPPHEPVESNDVLINSKIFLFKKIIPLSGNVEFIPLPRLIYYWGA